MKARSFHSLVLVVALFFGMNMAFAQETTVAPASPAAPRVEAQATTPAADRTDVSITDTERTVETSPAPAPSSTWTVFGMDSTAGVMIGIVLMLVFILAIVAVSRNERTTVA